MTSWRPVARLGDRRAVRRLGGTVHGIAFLIELAALNGRSQLTDENVFSVLSAQ